MNTIDIGLSRKNLRILMRHIFVANWILTSTKVERDADLDAFYQTMLSIGHTHKVLEGIEYDEGSGEFDISEELSETWMNDISAYEEEIFWEELASRLAGRDAVEIHGPGLADMEQLERAKAIWHEEEKYDEEFEKHGLARIRIVKKS